MRLRITECLQTRNARRVAGEPELTKAQIAKALDVHPSQVTRWDRGERPVTIDIAHRVAEVIGCDITDLFPMPAGCLDGNTRDAA